MKSFAAVVILSVVIGAMADYPAPAHKYAEKPAYHAPAPAYHAPAAHHAAPYHAPVVHAYAAKAPHVKCGANLLVGCAPNVAHVPCVPAHGGHGYGHAAPAHGYGHGHAAPAHYRAFGEADSFDNFEE